MTTPFPFVAAAVLTAAQQNAITTLPITAKTVSATLTAAESVGYRVTMSNAAATTITINSAVYGVGDTIWIANIGAGTTTLTAGAGVTLSTAGSLAVVQNQGGTLVMTSSTAGTFYPTAVTAAASGFTLISRTTPTAANTLAFDGVFSTTYTAYYITLENFLCTSLGATLSVNTRYGSTTNTVASWYGNAYGSAYNTTAFQSTTTASATSFVISPGVNSTVASGGVMQFSGVGTAGKVPQVVMQMANAQDGGARSGGATLQSTAQTWTGFILSASAGNISGTIGIYGLASA